MCLFLLPTNHPRKHSCTYTSSIILQVQVAFIQTKTSTEAEYVHIGPQPPCTLLLMHPCHSTFGPSSVAISTLSHGKVTWWYDLWRLGSRMWVSFSSCFGIAIYFCFLASRDLESQQLPHSGKYAATFWNFSPFNYCECLASTLLLPWQWLISKFMANVQYLLICTTVCL